MERMTVEQAIKAQNELMQQIIDRADGMRFLLRDLPDFGDKNLLCDTVRANAQSIIRLAQRVIYGDKPEFIEKA